MAAVPGTLASLFATAPADDALTRPRLRACLDCGQFQTLPAMAPGVVARCNRCGAELRRVRHDPLGRGLALNLAALVLLAVACTATLLTVSTFGMYRSATVLSGPLGFGQHNVWSLAAVVAFMTVVAPLLRLALVTYVLLGLRMPTPPCHLRDAFRIAERMRPWSMIEVYLLGVFVAFTELPSSVHVDVGLGVYALITLMLTVVAADAVLDRQAVWEAMEQRGLTELPVGRAAAAQIAPLAAPLANALTCETCRLVCRVAAVGETHCPRCGSRVEARKPDSIARTWALVATSVI